MHPVDNCSDKVLVAHRSEPISEAPARFILQWSGWSHGDIPSCRNMGSFVDFAVYSIQETPWTRFLSPQRPEVFMQEVCVPIAKKSSGGQNKSGKPVADVNGPVKKMHAVEMVH